MAFENLDTDSDWTTLGVGALAVVERLRNNGFDDLKADDGGKDDTERCEYDDNGNHEKIQDAINHPVILIFALRRTR